MWYFAALLFCAKSFEEIISKNYKIRQILSSISDIATNDSAVPVEGPSGSGKELFAKARREGRFIVQNCPTLLDRLLKSESFGYK